METLEPYSCVEWNEITEMSQPGTPQQKGSGVRFGGLANLVSKLKRKSKKAQGETASEKKDHAEPLNPGNITSRGVVIQMESEGDLSNGASSSGGDNSPQPANTYPVSDYNRMLAERRARVLHTMRECIDSIVVKENEDSDKKQQEKLERERVSRELERLRTRPTASDQEIKAAQEEMKRERQQKMQKNQNGLGLVDLLEMDYREESDFWDIKLNLVATRLKQGRQNRDQPRKSTPATSEKRETPKESEKLKTEVKPGYPSGSSAEADRRIPERPKEIEDPDIADYVEALESVVQSDIKTILSNSDGLGKGKKGKEDTIKKDGFDLPTVEN